MGMREATKSRTGLLLAAAVVLSGCQALPEPKPPASPQAQVLTPRERVAVAATGSGPARTGTYPSFSDPLKAANVQMENDQAKKVESRLSALGAARRAGTVTEAEYQRRLAELRALAADHGPAAEAAITK